MRKSILAWVLVLCMLLGGASVAQATQTTDFDALKPIMDLVASAAISANDTPEAVGGEDSTLTPVFVAQFFNNGLTADASLAITEDMLGDTAKQAAVLSHIFAAQLPPLEAIVKANPINGYIGFQPVTINAGSSEDVQIIGELYWAEKAMAQLSDEQFREVQWLDRAVFSFRADANALNGYRLTGFSVGSELMMEEALQGYFEQILVEYVNTSLGFEMQYPSVFTDDLLVEDGDGVSATLPDGSVTFFAKRVDNASQANLSDYVGVIANGLSGSKSSVNDTFNYATVAYDTEEGYSVFDIYIVTDKYIYQAELSYRKDLAATYQMYTSYLENSFLVYEVSVG